MQQYKEMFGKYMILFYSFIYFITNLSIFANIINLGCIVTAYCGFAPVPANTKSVNREI